MSSLDMGARMSATAHEAARQFVAPNPLYTGVSTVTAQSSAPARREEAWSFTVKRASNGYVVEAHHCPNTGSSMAAGASRTFVVADDGGMDVADYVRAFVTATKVEA